MIAKRTARLLAGRDADAARERPVLRLLPHLRRRARLVVAPLGQGSGLGEFPPVAAQAVEPLAADVIVHMLDPVAIGRDREIAALRGRPVDIGGGEVQRAQAPSALENACDAAVAAIVPERAGDRVVDRGVGVVLHLEGEQSRRHRGVAFVVRNERTERGHPHLSRERRRDGSAISAIGKRPMKVASSKCGAPAIESRLAPKPKPSNLRRLGEPVGSPS